MNALPFFKNIKIALTAEGTGGMSWHVHALRSGKRWRVTKDQIEEHLFKCFEMNSPMICAHAGKPTLILIGASAGWMMSTRWLACFAQIDAYDIDPLAPLLFRLNHGKALKRAGCVLNFHNLDAIDQLDRVLRLHPSAWIWFDNVLGQHRFRMRNLEMTSMQLKILQLRLKGRFWGSVHDLYSGSIIQTTPARPAKGHQSQPIAHLERLDNSDQDSARVNFNAHSSTLGQARQQFLLALGATNANGGWVDHETSNVFPPKTPLTWVSWDFKPLYRHCLEMGWVSPNKVKED